MSMTEGHMNSLKRRRERVLACLAFVMLIVAWDATLRLDERMSPPRMRMSHAVEMEGEMQTMASVE
jgi:predicted metal-binding membrane protein